VDHLVKEESKEVEVIQESQDHLVNKEDLDQLDLLDNQAHLVKEGSRAYEVK